LTQDCGGFAHYKEFTPVGQITPLPAAGPNGYVAHAVPTPPGPQFMPAIPFPRDWAPFATSDADSTKAISRLLRFTTALVNYNSGAGHMSEYTLAEGSRQVVAVAPGTPIAGVLFDAYNYFKHSVFETDDPQAACRDYRIIFITDGIEECHGQACSGMGQETGNTNGGPSKDLGLIKLPQQAARMAAIAAGTS